MRFRYLLLLSSCLAASCGLPAHPSQLLGTYYMVSPLAMPIGPQLDGSLQLGEDKAIYRFGSTEHSAEYTVDNDHVYLHQGDARIVFQRIGRDTLRQSNGAGFTVDYVRVP